MASPRAIVDLSTSIFAARSCSDCHRGVLFLIVARQSNWRAVVRFVYKLQWRFAFSGSRANDLFGLGSLRGSNNGNSGFNDSSFFSGDFSERVSQPFFMIKIDLCDYRDIRLNRVGRIKASAYTGLENDNVECIAVRRELLTIRFGSASRRDRKNVLARAQSLLRKMSDADPNPRPDCESWSNRRQPTPRKSFRRSHECVRET